MTPEDTVRDGLDAYWEAPSEYHSALAVLVAERDRLAARLAEAERQRDEALASVVLYLNERDAARDGWEAQVRSEEREMRRRIEAEARADNLTPYVQRSQQFEARVAALTEALAAYRSALRSGEPESERLRGLGDAALAAADRPEGTCSWCDLHGSCDPPNCPKRADRPEGTTPQEGNA